MKDWSEDYRDYTEGECYDDPSPFNISTKLIEGCSVCGKGGVLRCHSCKVVHYCRLIHQYAHRKQHKSVCNKIKKAQEVCDEEEVKLRAGLNGTPDWNYPLEERWPRILALIYYPMREYMNARCAV
ncbi:hypothetical protein PMIN06_011447 [Paraphaeosphaeria minitans]